MYKASKYEVSPDMKLVLLAYNVQLVRPVFIWVLYVCVEMKVIMAQCERAVTLHCLTRTKIHPAGVTETQKSHTHTCQSRERMTEAVFTFGLIGWSELSFYSTLTPISFHIVLYSMAPNHRVSA